MLIRVNVAAKSSIGKKPPLTIRSPWGYGEKRGKGEKAGKGRAEGSEQVYI